MSERGFNEIFSERLREYLNKYGMTQAELAKRLGVGTTSVYNWLNAIKTPRMDKIDAMCALFHCKRSDLIEDKTSIPVYGRVAAGIPLEMITDMEILEEAPKDGYFGLRIHGDSMSPQICDGDVVLVKEQPDAETGDIVIATINGDEAVCKRLRKYTGGIELISNNPSYDPLQFSAEEVDKTPVNIIGKVIQLRRDF